MEKEIDPSLIKATQASLGKYVKRPPLTEKLLKKPPFRFLHDVITTVLKTTGFFEGLFEEEELVSDNVKDRESKILFLNKVISVVGLTTGKTLSAKPSKIVAGHEADKTNELLQCLAQALDKKLSSNEAVKKVKEGTKTSQTTDTKQKENASITKKSTDSKKLTSRSSEKLSSQKKDQKDESNIKTGNRERVSKSKEDTHKQGSPPKQASQKSKTINKIKGENVNQHPNSNSDTSKEPSKVIANNQVNNDEKDRGVDIKKAEKIIPATKSILPEKGEQEQLDASYTIAENELNSSSSSHDLLELSKNNIGSQPRESISASINDLVTAVEEKNMMKEVADIENKEHIPDSEKSLFESNTSAEKVSTTKNSENKDQDRVLSAKNIETVANIVRPASVRPSSSRPGAPRLRDKHGTTEQGTENLMGKVNIIIENNANEEEEDNSIIIVEHQPDNNSLDQPVQLSSNQHGHLVQQILDSQKEFSQINGKTEIEWQFGAQKAREAANVEIEQVRFNIQALSRVANPLGRLLDHIQEDVEVMRQELQQWTKTYEETSSELLKQKMASDDSLLPLHTKNKQLDADIKEKQDKIDDLKIVIHKNSTRIEKLLASGIVQ